MRLCDQLENIQKIKKKAINSDKISIRQFKKLLGCEMALTWMHDGLSLSEIYDNCDFILSHYCGDPIIYATIKNVSAINLSKISGNNA